MRRILPSLAASFAMLAAARSGVDECLALKSTVEIRAVWIAGLV